MSKPIRDDILAAHLATARWRKSSHSGQLGNCVEAATLDCGDVALRNSRHPAGPMLILTCDGMAVFVAGTKNGEFAGRVPHRRTG
ncbi:MAG: DUF397 domain-containing protein [Pseudonocardiaceae bacterium]